MANPTTAFRSGKNGKIVIQGVGYALNHWEVTETGEVLDTNNFECFTQDFGTGLIGGGRSFSQGMIGFESADFTISGVWNAAQNPFEEPPGLYVSDLGPELILYINESDGTNYTFANTIISSTSVTTDATGAVSFSATGKNQGSYIRPTGNV